jgi:dihydroxy-acid dehydratase
MAGVEIVHMVHDDRRLSTILTRQAIENTIVVNAAVGGSTNFIIHLLAIAARVGIDLDLDDFDRIGSRVPLLVNLMPSGQYLMEDFYYAGGLPVVMKDLGDLLHRDCLMANGKTLDENYADAACYNRDVIHCRDEPLLAEGGSVVCRGNLAENGAIIKPSAATPALLQHRGRAVVFENIEHYKSRIDDPDLDVDEGCVLVLKMVGPKGYPGMAEVGNMGLPRKLLDKGVTDMVRISDGRMSGTAFGTVFLHVCPESADGGTLALVHDGDMIEVDVGARRLHLDVSDAELARRRECWQPPQAVAHRGYAGLYVQHVLGADRGADLDFLVGRSGSTVTRDSH